MFFLIFFFIRFATKQVFVEACLWQAYFIFAIPYI